MPWLSPDLCHYSDSVAPEHWGPEGDLLLFHDSHFLSGADMEVTSPPLFTRHFDVGIKVNRLLPRRSRRNCVKKKLVPYHSFCPPTSVGLFPSTCTSQSTPSVQPDELSQLKRRACSTLMSQIHLWILLGHAGCSWLVVAVSAIGLLSIRATLMQQLFAFIKGCRQITHTWLNSKSVYSCCVWISGFTEKGMLQSDMAAELPANASFTNGWFCWRMLPIHELT